MHTLRYWWFAIVYIDYIIFCTLTEILFNIQNDPLILLFVLPKIRRAIFNITISKQSHLCHLLINPVAQMRDFLSILSDFKILSNYKYGFQTLASPN